MGLTWSEIEPGLQTMTAQDCKRNGMLFRVLSVQDKSVIITVSRDVKLRLCEIE